MQAMMTIARYSLIRALKEHMTFLIGLLMPAAMMFVLGISISGEGEPTVTVDVLDQDNSALSQDFVARLQAEIDLTTTGDAASFRLCNYADPIDDCDLDSDLKAEDWLSTADDRLEATDSYGAIIIAPGFGEQLRAETPVTVTFKNSNELAAPTLVEQKIDAALSRMNSSIAISNLVVGQAAAAFDALPVGSPERAAAFDQVRADVETQWDERPVLVEVTATQENDKLQNGFNQSGPGVATMFVLMFMLNTSTALLVERENGTLARMFSLPIRRAQALGGLLLGQYVYGLLQYLVLIIVGAMMGVEWGSNVLGIALIVLSFTFTATSLGLTVGTLVRTSDQANGASLLLGLTLSPLGGAWWPLEIVPDFMRIIGHVSPVAWAMDAFVELMWYDGTVTSILPMIGVLVAMGAALFAFGVLMFKYE